jgi:hypothetical protein
MTENTKSLVYVAVGIVAVLIGWLTGPSAAEVDEGSLVGTNLAKDFKDPESAKRLRIVRFDEDTATLREFEVAEQNGLWTIPSKDGYPADAARQMAEAATSLMDRKIYDIASKNAGDHEQFGVIDPLSPKLEPGQKGVGTRVTMSDSQNKPLADLIVGKSVRGADAQRYVREAGRDVVYIIEIDPSKLSTNFEDWIEKDLLKLNGWDLQQVEVKDYSAELVQGMTPDGRFGIGIDRKDNSDMTLAYNDADAKWNPVTLKRFDTKQGKRGEYVDFKLADDEELNSENLNALKNALDDLKIVDVVHKPTGLSHDLKAGSDFMNSREAQIDLMSKGFTAVSGGDGNQGEIISAFGEAVATMKNGTEYVLRFGDLTNVADKGKEEKTDEKAAVPADKDKAGKEKAINAKGDKKGDKGEKSDVHRYMFVMARFNESAVKRPEKQKVPELPAKAAGAADAKTPATDGAKADAAPAEGAAKAEVASATKDDAAAKKDESVEKKDDVAAKKEDGDTKKEDSAEKKDDATAKKDDAEVKKDDAAAAKDDATAKKDDATAKTDASTDKDLEKLIADRKRIEEENKKKEDEYQALIKKGQENVKELNLRFGDWYFVIGDDVFRKIRLSREQIIKKKEKPKEGEAGQGEKKDAATPPPGIPGLPAIPGANK